MSILEKINSSADVKKLSAGELEPLCGEIRSFLVDSVSRTGGHLASNLGTVELTVALHRVYDTAKDRIVFDVGHQSYAHKILTGRRERFDTLRQYQGLSGFPKPYEAVDDAFIAGHASNSISVGLGMARARTLRGEDYDVAAIIGDGAMTGGLSYEGLTNAAASGEPLVIILNDNNMSISENVGGTASLLERLRVKPGYINFKRWYRRVFLPLRGIYNFNHRIKEWLKARLLPANIFNEMGLQYLGPIDGHDVHQLETAFRWARDLRAPVLVHVQTRKGKGCSYAEANPEIYHGVGPFDPVSGKLHASEPCFSECFGRSLCELAARDDRIVTITAAMADGTGLNAFAERYPKRFFDVGIAEGNGVSMAAGMAKQGLVPVFAVYSSFLQRGYDMLLHDIALEKLHAVFAVDRAGLVGNDGETHHGVFDVDYLGSVPGMTILCPASFQELRDMLEQALFQIDGPVAVRFPRGGEGRYAASNLNDECILCEGKDLTIVCYGTLVNEGLKAVELLSASGITAELIKLGRIKPNLFSKTLDSVRKTKKILVVEEVCQHGCVGEEITSAMARQRISAEAALLMNLGSGIAVQGSVPELYRHYRLDAEGIANAAAALCGRSRGMKHEEDQTGSTGI